jgi:signal transduction histidine kinase/DNA-binding response OmpR family regulator/CHASE3 domain sensor protein
MASNFRRNLIIGFSASLIILLVSSVASFMSISNLLVSADLVNRTNNVIIRLNDVNTGLIDAETGQRGYLLTGEAEFLSPYNDARARVMKAFEQVRTLTLENPEQQHAMGVLAKIIDDRFHYLDLSIDDKRADKEFEIRNLRKGREIMVQVREQLAIMEQRERDLMVGRTESMNRFAMFTPVLIVIASIIAVAITILFYFRVRSDFEERTQLQLALERKDAEISNRISIIRGIADQIAQGSYSTRVGDKQSDALGSVAGSLNKMAESLERSFTSLSEKEWTQTGIAGLNDVMIGEKSTDVLCHDVISYLSTYTQSQAGAIYVLERDLLKATSSFAYAIPPAKQKIRLNEGILGEALSNKKSIELRDIPSDNIQVSYIGGEVKPNHVVALPIFDGYTPKGALELATLGTYNQVKLDFLAACAPNIGIAINTAENRRRLQELLEETQSQSEELKVQHSELENLNSELEVQAEKLQTSEEELKVQQEELKQANTELEERSRLLEERNHVISERNLEIQSKADELAQSTKYKSEFLANMSHELRTPLNSILLLSRLMSENKQQNLNEEQMEYARVIQSSGHGLLSLIDEILDLSKIEAGKMQLEWTQVPITEIVDDMKALFFPVATEKKIEFRTAVTSQVSALIETDKLRFEQILKNLLSNAIKFTQTGYVELKFDVSKTKNDHLRITVKDTGIGIPKEKHSLVFEAFQQADGSTRRKFGGTGLGLSISRELSKLLGGEITLESEPGAGSRFTLEIPARKTIVKENKVAVPEKATPVPSPTEKREQKYISTTIPESIPDDRRSVAPGDKVVLIIEDDVNFAKALLEFTRRNGYKGIVAVRGDEGIELAKKFVPLGILLDLQLPVKSGWEVMEELKNTPETRMIPVHMMSSYDDVRFESLQKGAIDFKSKPVAIEQMNEIFKKIEYVLTHHPKKVLIVEENARHAKALAYFLGNFDINLEIDHEVSSAIRSLQQKDVDCVILDMGIPDQGAYDTLEAIKKTKGLEGLPIIIFTGKALSQAEEMKIRQYADSIVLKTAHSYQRIIDEVSLFLHLMDKNKPDDQAPKMRKLGGMDEVLKGKTVLVADDDMRNIFSMTKALEKYQMKVVTAIDGKDALKKLKATPGVDVVLMDMMMPEMDGYESTTAIRKIPKYKDLPIIAVTAKAMMGDRIKCINAGASDYITKPVDVDQLFSLLRVWLYEKN